MAVFLEAFDVYRYYIGLKTHFTSEAYDFVKYRSGLNVSEKSFSKRSDMFFFHKFAEMIEKNDVIPFIISQFIENGRFTSVKSFVTNPVRSQKNYDNWISRVTNLSEIYRKDIITISEKSDGSWQSVIKSPDTDYPVLYKLVSSKDISPETYSFIISLFGIYDDEYDVVFQKMNLKYKKYRVFLNMTDEQIAKITPRNLEILRDK